MADTRDAVVWLWRITEGAMAVMRIQISIFNVWGPTPLFS